MLIPEEANFISALWIGFIKVALPYTVAATMGVSFVYFIAYFGGRALIEKFKMYLGFSWKDIEEISKKFGGGAFDAVMIFLLRAVPVVPISIISAVCGFIRTKIVLFYVFSLFGILVRSVILAMVGWQMQEGYKAIIGGLDKVEDMIKVVSIFLILFLFYLGYRNRGRFLKK